MVKADWASHRLSARLLYSFLLSKWPRVSNINSTPMRKLAKLAIAALLTCGVFAAEKKEVPTYLDAKAGGQDFIDQGEYKNDWGGAQVIALGNNEFRMVTFRGGLPGDGWDKEFRTETPGKREGTKVVFKGENGYRAELENRSITIHTAEGGPYNMEKTERKSPTQGAKAPDGAVVLFDGSGVENWVNGHLDDQGRKLLAAGTKSKQSFTNFRAHLEFLLPFKPLGRGQDRGNSGVYVQDRYEIQVLDSFGLKGEDNECGGVYTLAKPLVNMCYPPLTWQTYDIEFTSAKFDPNGKKIKNAELTLKHNGVVVHDKLELKSNTPGNGKKEDASGGPFQLQGHGNPVFYRNIWVAPN